MTVSDVTPPWAVELVARVCAEAGVAPPSALRWRRRARTTSSGVTRRHDASISVSAGTEQHDQRLTLLHELAHWVGPEPGRHGRGRGARHHDRRFYAVAFDIYRRHGLQPAAALAGEAARYPSSLRHAVALGIPGAAEAARARRAELRARRGTWQVAVPEHAIRLERDGRWTVCGTCRQRIVGAALARLRRRRSPARHVLMRRVPAPPPPTSPSR